MKSNLEVRMCPKCGKPMDEQPKFPGLWVCEDGKIPLNDAPPFRFKCDGLELTNEGARALHTEILRLHATDRKAPK